MSQVKDSQLYQTLADMARFLEANAKKTDYGFVDGGESLEIRKDLLSQCRSNPDWLILEKRYEQVNGHIYSPDADLDLPDWG
jgi:hypothetical protein